MLALAASGLSAFFVCLLLTPMVRDAFANARIVDHPDGHRKLHEVPIPRAGGIAILLAYAIALALVFFIFPQSVTDHSHRALFLSFVPATGIVFLTGLLDDFFTLTPLQKLFGQSVAAALAVALGAHANGLPLIVSFLWLLLCTNAFNLIDGMDGVATGVALFASSSTLLVALLTGNHALALASLPLVACLFAFLRYNFSPATIFLGDCGSLTLGFLLGCFGLAWSQHTPSASGLLAPAAALALPLADVVLSIARRSLRGASILAGDRGHIHHMVRARTRSKRVAVLALYSVCACASLFAVILSFATGRYLAIVSTLFCVVAALFAGGLRYTEFTAARRTLLRRFSTAAIRDEMYLLEINQSLAAAVTVEAFWKVALASARSLRLTTIRMTLHGNDFSATLKPKPHDVEPTWTLSMPLGATGELHLTAPAHAEPSHLTFPVFHSLRLAVERKEQAAGWTLEEDAEPSLSFSGAA